ncbi:RNA 2',3'-cyclic phosphodiesterase [Natranaeroarchaeum aerophilus]|uniref:RNA 2',3'-cyclic phosphodiesterase n=1 Tax=Natranaeroarchaeum aerophilus TaxID=2917711 RepID=A0AAE3K6Q4_9EURY|nr:RNA 2',3'-cyclic phosphodiesterase [Natranaeroarchaeum aerophilus]MCL9815248.1 RNA 2',3'-cyclic phosphodiesterase [Natranaeroarchaeum aerophilus]
MSKRLFVSVDLPDELADEVAAVQEEFREASGLRFTDPEQAHLTLFFLGDVAPDRVTTVESALTEAVETAAIDPFTAHVEGLGVFPSLQYISVLWAGVSAGADELTALHEAVEPRLVGLGFDADDHEFTPHVTLARMDHAGGKELVQQGVRELDPVVGEWTVEEVRLTESELTPDGPEYSTVRRFEL